MASESDVQLIDHRIPMVQSLWKFGADDFRWISKGQTKMQKQNEVASEQKH